MNTPKILILVSISLLLSCEHETINPAVTETLATAYGNSEDQRLPIFGVINAELVSFTSIPNEQCGTEASSNPSFTGVGKFRHIGSIYVPEASHCNLPPISEDPYLFQQINGQISFYTNQGDRFDATYTGITELLFEDEAQIGELQFTIIGGTGRFKGAQGEMKAKFEGTINTDPITFVGQFRGHLILKNKSKHWGHDFDAI